MNDQQNADIAAPWRVLHSDGTPTVTTEWIVRIDQELSRAQRVMDDVTCLICGRSGVPLHTHTTPDKSEVTK